MFSLEPIDWRALEANRSAVVLVVRPLEVAVLVGEAARHEERRALVAAGDLQVVVSGETGIEDLGLMIVRRRARGERRAPRADVERAVDAPRRRPASCGDAALSVRALQQVRCVRRCRTSRSSRGCTRVAPAAAALRRDENHAVRRARAVDRGRCATLQDLDRLDVVRIDVRCAVLRHRAAVLARNAARAEQNVRRVDRVVDRLAVDDEQRLVACRLPTSRPRILIDADAPGSPDCVRTSTFGAFAASADTTFCGSLERRSAELSTVLIVVVRRSRVVDVPAPVITTSPR